MLDQISARYLGFADVEAAGRSPAYEALARHVATSPQALAFLAKLPKARQQPNLFFAAMRLVFAGVPTEGDCDSLLVTHEDQVAEVMLSRTTQTNEPARCATLVPALGQIDGPIALIEVGASAGLCLLPDFYGYDWGFGRLGAQGNAPTFPCVASPNTPIPQHHPDIVWRAGLDLNPLDVGDPDNVSWLETLVWPEDVDRLARLKQSVSIAKAHPPRIVKGDLTQDLAGLLDEAPKDATLVVFHTAVLNYVSDQAVRDQFAKDMQASRAIWLANEGAGVFPQFARPEEDTYNKMFRLTRNGETLAWTGPHGQVITWL